MKLVWPEWVPGDSPENVNSILRAPGDGSDRVGRGFADRTSSLEPDTRRSRGAFFRSDAPRPANGFPISAACSVRRRLLYRLPRIDSSRVRKFPRSGCDRTALTSAQRGRLDRWGLCSSAHCSFFAITNFGVWRLLGSYSKTPVGLLACYIAGVPFFWNTLAGDAIYSALLFGGFALAERFSRRLQEPLGQRT